LVTAVPSPGVREAGALSTSVEGALQPMKDFGNAAPGLSASSLTQSTKWFGRARMM